MKQIYIPSINCFYIVRHYESLHDGDLTKINLQPKQDPIGIYTAGFGHALFKPDGTGITVYADIAKYCPEFLDITIEEAEQLLVQDLTKVGNQINALGLNITQNEFDACCSFVFNLGITRFKTSTLLRRIISGVGDIADAFKMWNKGTIKGVRKTLPGLVYRRQSEYTLYLTGKVLFFN